MKWGDGLRVNPGVLHSRATQLDQVLASLESQIAEHEALELGSWRGEARRAYRSSHRKLLSSMRSHSRRIPPVSGGLSSAGSSFENIQIAQHDLIGTATSWQFRITDSGFVIDTASGLSLLDPKRRIMHGKIQGSVVSIQARLLATDVTLAAKLRIPDRVSDVRDMFEGAGNSLQDGLDWGRDTMVDAAIDNIERMHHAGTAFDRLKESMATPPKWLEDWLIDGEKPQLSEVLGHSAYLGGQALGIPANFIAKKDLHFFDDGSPYMAGRDDVQKVNHDPVYNGPQSMVKTMEDLYGVAKGQERAQIQVTAIEDEHGVVRYVATIPGTLNDRDGWNGDAAGTDWPANFRGVGYGDTAATQSAMNSIQLAIEQDMVDREFNPDQHRPEVVLSGHSQGGIMAGNIANNEGFNERFNVSGVVTAGTPIDTLGVPEHIPVYNYQNSGDLVPKVDLGGAPSGQPGNVTNIPLPHNGDSPMPGPSHDVERYGENVRNLHGPGSYGSAESHARQSQMNTDLGRFYNGKATTYRVTYGRETN